MAGISFVAVVVAVLAAFVMSTAWYIVFAKQRLKLSGGPLGRISVRAADGLDHVGGRAVDTGDHSRG
jgi:hypothetical protein